MIQQYLGKDQADPEEMEAAKHAYEAHKETGMEHEAAYEAAGKHLKMAMAIGHKMAQCKQSEGESEESESESESEAEESESESESHHEANTSEPPAKPGKKGTPSPTGGAMEKKKESMVIQLSGEVAKLRESVKKYELRDHLDKKLRESGKSNIFTKKFREALGAPKSTAHIDEMWQIFVKAADAGAEEVGSEEGLMFEKNNYRESDKSTGKFDLTDCLR